MKKALRDANTARAGCSKVEPKIFAPPQTPFPGAQDDQILISWRCCCLPTNPVWWGLMHVISSYRGNRPINTPTNTQTGPITIIHCAAKLSAQCNKLLEVSSALHCYRWISKIRLQVSSLTAVRLILLSYAFPVVSAQPVWDNYVRKIREIEQKA